MPPGLRGGCIMTPLPGLPDPTGKRLDIEKADSVICGENLDEFS